jgi:hypothetical protein
MKSNPILSNFEKIIFGALIIVSLVVFVIYQGSIYARDESIKTQIANLRFSQPPETMDGIEKYATLMDNLKTDKDYSNYSTAFKRNGFLKYIEPPPEIPPFQLKAVRRKYLDIEYKGFIESLSRGVVAQLKIKDRTFFVKEGDEVQGYTVKRVRSEYLLLTDSNGSEYRLPLREQVLSNEYEAAIYVTKTHKTVRAEIGDVINNFKVLDISPNNVVLLNQKSNQELIIEK